MSVIGSDHYTPLFDVSKDVSDMMCGLFDVNGKIVLSNSENLSDDEKTLYLCTNLCASSSYVCGNAKLPVLRRLVVEEDGSVNMNIHNILWLDTSSKVLRQVRMYITDSTGKIAAVDHCSLVCTVLAFPKKYNN